MFCKSSYAPPRLEQGKSGFDFGRLSPAGTEGMNAKDEG